MKLCGGGGGARAQPATASPAPSRGSRPLPVPRQPPPPLLWGTRETLGDGWGVNGGVRGPGHLWEKAPGRSGRQAGSGQLTSGEGSQREQAAAKRGRDPPTPGPAAVRGGRPPLGTPRASAKLRSARREGSGGKARRGGRCLSPPTADLGSFPPPGWGGGGRWDPEPSATMVSAPAGAGEARRGATPVGVAINADPHRCSEVVGLCQRLNRRQLPGTGRRGGRGSHLSRRACHNPALSGAAGWGKDGGSRGASLALAGAWYFSGVSLYSISALGAGRGAGGRRFPPSRSWQESGEAAAPGGAEAVLAASLSTRLWDWGTAELIYLFLPPPAAFLLEGRRVQGQGGWCCFCLSPPFAGVGTAPWQCRSRMWTFLYVLPTSV